MTFNVTIFNGRRFTVSLSIPRPTRRRLIGTGALCSAATTLFLTPGALGWPGVELSPKLIGLAVLVPFGVGGWSLAWAEWRTHRESVPLLDEYPQRAYEPKPAQEAQTVPVTFVARPGEVIEGEVLR